MEYKIFSSLNKALTIIIEIFCLICLIVSSYFIYDSWVVMQGARASNLSKYKAMIIEENGRPSLRELQALNPDIVGWITLDNTNIDYPILRTTSVTNYLNRDMFGRPNLTGSLYILEDTSRDFSDDVSVIYGHHMADGSMLGGIDEYFNESYLSSHNTGLLITENATYSVTVLAVARTNAYSGIYLGASISNLKDFIVDETLQIECGTLDDINIGDRVVVLSTCTSDGSLDRSILITRIEEVNYEET